MIAFVLGNVRGKRDVSTLDRISVNLGRRHRCHSSKARLRNGHHFQTPPLPVSHRSRAGTPRGSRAGGPTLAMLMYMIRVSSCQVPFASQQEDCSSTLRPLHHHLRQLKSAFARKTHFGLPSLVLTLPARAVSSTDCTPPQPTRKQRLGQYLASSDRDISHREPQTVLRWSASTVPALRYPVDPNGHPPRVTSSVSFHRGFG